MRELEPLEEQLTAALRGIEASDSRAFARLLFAEADRAAEHLGVDAALVLDQYERGSRLEWLLALHRDPRPGSTCPRARAFRTSMLQAALDVRRRDRQRRDPLYAHLEQKYRRIATPKRGLWIARSMVGRAGIETESTPRGDRKKVVPGHGAPLPPMPRLASERYVSGNDEAHAAFIRSCIEQAGGPLAHRQLVRAFLDAHGAAAPILVLRGELDSGLVAEPGWDDDDEATWVSER